MYLLVLTPNGTNYTTTTTCLIDTIPGVGERVTSATTTICGVVGVVAHQRNQIECVLKNWLFLSTHRPENDFLRGFVLVVVVVAWGRCWRWQYFDRVVTGDMFGAGFFGGLVGDSINFFSRVDLVRLHGVAAAPSGDALGFCQWFISLDLE